MKKIMMILMLLSVCSSVRVIPVYAQTVDFNVTVNNKDLQLTNSDTYSRRAEKKDNENNFYITVKSASNSTKINAFSRGVSKKELTSYPVAVGKFTINKTKKSTYCGTAKAGQVFRLYTYLMPGNSGKVNIKGRFTP